MTASGPPAPTLSEMGALPGGVSFNPATGVFSGTPLTGTAGTYLITFTASNGVGTNATQNFTLTVVQAPAITSASSAAFLVGSTGAFTVTATGVPTPALTETGALPAGISFDPATGVLSGTPAAGTGGFYAITFSAINGVSPPATQTFTLAVGDFTMTASPPSQSVAEGVPATFTVVLKPLGGLMVTVMLSCHDHSNGSTCTSNPPNAVLNGIASTTVTYTVSPSTTEARIIPLTITGQLGKLVRRVKATISVY